MMSKAIPSKDKSPKMQKICPNAMNQREFAKLSGVCLLVFPMSPSTTLVDAPLKTLVSNTSVLSVVGKARD